MVGWVRRVSVLENKINIICESMLEIPSTYRVRDRIKDRIDDWTVLGTTTYSGSHKHFIIFDKELYTLCE